MLVPVSVRTLTPLFQEDAVFLDSSTIFHSYKPISLNIPCFAIKAEHIFYKVCDLLISLICSGPIPEMSTSYPDPCKSYQPLFRSKIILPLQLYVYLGKVSFYITEHFREMNGIATKWINFFRMAAVITPYPWVT